MTAFHNQFQIFDNAQLRSLSWFSAVPEWNRAVINVIIYTCAFPSKLGNVSVKMSVVMNANCIHILYTNCENTLKISMYYLLC